MSLSIDNARTEIEMLAGESQHKKMLGVVAILTELTAEHQIFPCIVGGFAVELYTQNSYSTADIDIIFSRRDIANTLLLDLGFEKEGKSWYHPKLEVSIEIPNDMLEDADNDKITILKMENDRKVYVIGIEDIILDRLRACIHWKSTDDCEWAFRLFKTHFDHLDLNYMKQSAERDKTLDKFNSWLI
jgi:hypothetical protein